MLVTFDASFTSYSAVTCTVGLRSGEPMNNADPRVIWKRLLRTVYSPRSAFTAPTSVSASPWTETWSGPSV
jgi:hypothetical protein